ncbi:MAG: hypothetical protein IKJ74_03165 [Clostridia bacterium]|nr:hypothetical protein [Clostridia bacterium]
MEKTQPDLERYPVPALLTDEVFTPFVSAELEGKVLRLSFAFSDEENIFSAMASLFQADGDFSCFSAAMGLAPLFSVIALCRMSGIGLEMRRQEKAAQIVMTMPGGRANASFFLENSETPDEAWFESWLREILFLNKKM